MRARQHLPETYLLRLDVESRYAVTLYWSNRLEEAAVIQADLLDRRQSVQGPAHPDTIHLMMSMSLHWSANAAPRQEPSGC